MAADGGSGPTTDTPGTREYWIFLPPPRADRPAPSPVDPDRLRQMSTMMSPAGENAVRSLAASRIDCDQSLLAGRDEGALVIDL